MVKHPFISADTSFPLLFLFVGVLSAFSRSPALIEIVMLNSLKPELSRALLLVLRGVSFRLTPSCCLAPALRSFSDSGWEGLWGISSPAASAVGSEQLTQGLVQSGLKPPHLRGQPLPWLGCVHGKNRAGLALLALHPGPPPSACAVFLWEAQGCFCGTSWTLREVARRLLQSLLSTRLKEPCSQTSCQVVLLDLTKNFGNGIWAGDPMPRCRSRGVFIPEDFCLCTSSALCKSSSWDCPLTPVEKVGIASKN